MKTSKHFRGRAARSGRTSSLHGHGVEGARDEAANAWRDLGREALLAGDVAEALWYLRGAVEADSDSATTWRLLGRCFEEMGEETRARRCHALAVRLHMRSGAPADAMSATSPLLLDLLLREPHET